MSLQMDEYRAKIINKILFAESQGEVSQLIDTAIKTLEQSKVDDNIVSQFVQKIIGDLEMFNPMTKEAQQWSNIKIAMILFNRIKNRVNAPAT